MGPGIQATGRVDPTLVTGWIFVLIGYTPYRLWENILGFGYFGPIEVPAILAMVGVLFAFIALLRSVDLQEHKARNLAAAAMLVGFVRLFLLPWF